MSHSRFLKKNSEIGKLQEIMHYYGIEEFLEMVSVAMADAADETEAFQNKGVSANYRYRRAQLDNLIQEKATNEDLKEYIEEIA